MAAIAAERDHAAALVRVRTEHRQAAAAAVQQGDALDTLKGQLQAIQRLAGVALGGSLVGTLARDLSESADSAANLAARIKLVTGEGPAAADALRQVFEIAKRTGTAVDSVGDLFTRLSLNSRELELSTADLLRLTETVTQAIQLSGASAQEAAAGVTQFAQAIASGKLQGDELRSLLENTPRLARALADGLGVTIGQLRELGTAGALTARQVINALQGQSQALQTEFQKLPPTVGRALENLSTAWTEYLGNADKATGSSSAAAEAINALARNLGTVADTLFSAGKAAAAYAALRLAQSFIDSATAARTAAAATAAATAATAAHTGATTANTAAQAANAAATAGSVGRLAGLFNALRVNAVTLGLSILATNIREIGTALGEGVAKLQGYGKALADLEIAHRADARAAREAAAERAALAQATQQAADRALGLTKESRALVGEFEGLRTKGESVADALKKIGKDIDLSDVRGITTAATALDALAQRGQLAGRQVREALADALKGADLLAFETQARAAFDNTSQGARRLAAALDAVLLESLRRAGTSAEELGTGFSKAATSAINDVDALAASLRTIGATGDDAGRALVSALDKATDAAGTARALQAVTDRVKALGAAGQLSGEQVTAALDRVQRKADELRPGINSLSEALRAFGLQTRAEVQTTADKLGEAYRVIATSADVSLKDQITAYGKWREAALAANKGVETQSLAVQRVILENRAAVAGLGDEFKRAMGDAAKATGDVTTALEQLNRAAANVGSALAGVRSAGGQVNKLAADGGADLSVLTPNNAPAVDNSFAFQVRDRLNAGGQFSESELAALQNGLATARNNAALAGGALVPSLTGQRDAEMWVDVFRRAIEQASGAGIGGGFKPPPVAQPVAARTVRVQLEVAGRSFPVTSDEATAGQLVRALESARNQSGL